MNNSEIVANVVTTTESLVVTSNETLENKEKLLKEIDKGKVKGKGQRKVGLKRLWKNGITFDFYGPFSSREKRLLKKLSPGILSVH